MVAKLFSCSLQEKCEKCFLKFMADVISPSVLVSCNADFEGASAPPDEIRCFGAGLPYCVMGYAGTGMRPNY